MLAIGRALITNPQLLPLDEPIDGLALSMSQRAIVLRHAQGETTWEGTLIRTTSTPNRRSTTNAAS
jgi:ABC-type molybdenum transport system ATPase subunit/photorepair protein PhrA